MKTKLVALIALLAFGNMLMAQTSPGRISGYIYEVKDSSKVIPLTKVWVETPEGNRFTKANLDGKFVVDALEPGIYNLYAKAIGFDTTLIRGISVTSDGITTANVYCTDDNLIGVVVIDHNRVKIEKDIVRLKIGVEDIENSPFIRDPVGLLEGTSSEIRRVEGTNDIIIRGSRPGDAVFYIDGVKADNISSIPGAALRGLEAYTGGIPAKYGDTTGGVVVLETKGYFDLYYAWKARQ